MRAEVLAVGTELLLGHVVDTNGAWLGEQLALGGIDHLRRTVVGDNHDRIVAAIREALERAEALIVTGGLGPTQDDITREAIAEVMGVPLVRHDDLVHRMRRIFEARGREMPESNLRQAEVPEGATPIEQRLGTAPGLICPVGDRVVYALPGVPAELREMVERAVVPDLRRRSGSERVIVSRVLRTWGESESRVAEMVAPRLRALDEHGNPTIAFQASGIEGIRVRITARARSRPEADELLAGEEARLRAILGSLVFGVDDQSMETVVGAALGDSRRTLAVAESLTGGRLAARLVDVPGASAWFRGGVVSYASDVKRQVLDVPPGPVVSAEAARAMALGVRRLLQADVGLATTGVAGPAEQDGMPPGTVWVGVALGDDTDAVLLHLPGDRHRVRDLTVISALDLLRRRLS